ncbi:phage structural protein [Paenibacillus zanthoxyli]|uniref:phage structural protein n=1 Tax=Paenibacillus zanthoxyli TaxID=369399 RepID=UPI0004720E34|nr:phage protein [Paenibacillus zanthoxyli]
MAEVKTYDAKDIAVIVGGVYLTGFGEDLVTVAKDEENWSVSVGAQGDVVRSKVNNPLGTITVTLQISSPQCSFLDKLANGGTLVPVSVVYNGTPKETNTATQAFLKKPADREYGSEAGEREYEFQCLDLAMN